MILLRSKDFVSWSQNIFFFPIFFVPGSTFFFWSLRIECIEREGGAFWMVSYMYLTDGVDLFFFFYSYYIVFSPRLHLILSTILFIGAFILFMYSILHTCMHMYSTYGGVLISPWDLCSESM